MCLVAFQKIFRKIFSGVWKRRRKIQIQKKTQATTQKKIAINGERGRSEIAIDASRDRAIDRFSSRVRALSLSLSLSFSGNILKGK